MFKSILVTGGAGFIGSNFLNKVVTKYPKTMWIKKFLISITKSIIILLIATLIFSSVTFDFPNLMKGVFGNIFSYASPDAQKQTISKLAETCASLDNGQGMVTIVQICSNASLLESMQQNCEAYRELKRRNIQVENAMEHNLS